MESTGISFVDSQLFRLYLTYIGFQRLFSPWFPPADHHVECLLCPEMRRRQYKQIDQALKEICTQTHMKPGLQRSLVCTDIICVAGYTFCHSYRVNV